jgi:hypothetical protein
MQASVLITPATRLDAKTCQNLLGASAQVATPVGDIGAVIIFLKVPK